MKIIRPNKKNYDFNDEFEVLRFVQNMIKYCDWLETQSVKIENIFSDEQIKAAENLSKVTEELCSALKKVNRMF